MTTIIMLFLLFFVPYNITYAGAEHNSFHEKKHYLLNIINSPDTTAEQKHATQLELIELCVGSKSATEQDLYQAQRLCTQLCDNYTASENIRASCNCLQAHMLCGIIQMPSANLDYNKAIAIYTKIINNYNLPQETRLSAQLHLAGLYAGACGSLPLRDYQKAHRLTQEILADYEMHDSRFYTYARIILAGILGGIYKELILGCDESLTDNHEYSDPSYAIQLYEQALEDKKLNDIERFNILWNITDIYLKEPKSFVTELWLNDVVQRLESNPAFSIVRKQLFECMVARKKAFHKEATQADIANALRVFSKALQSNVLDDTQKRNLEFELKKLRLINANNGSRKKSS